MGFGMGPDCGCCRECPCCCLNQPGPFTSWRFNFSFRITSGIDGRPGSPCQCIVESGPYLFTYLSGTYVECGNLPGIQYRATGFCAYSERTIGMSLRINGRPNSITGEDKCSIRLDILYGSNDQFYGWQKNCGDLLWTEIPFGSANCPNFFGAPTNGRLYPSDLACSNG